ncbi:MAG: hypothetical protein IJL85_06365 [Erysipelotrichaceae bacterium]|nr:hypothetical protein [Erysipelotrichaceae bacterium]
MKLLFMGRKKQSADLLRWTVEQGHEIVAVCTDDQFSNSPTAATARELNIPILSMEEAEEYVLSNEVDLIVSYLYWRKIRKPLIENNRYGCINFHPAILPDYKGCGGYNIAILYKLPEWGVTVHYVDENIDTGPIIRVKRFPFDYCTATAKSLEKITQDALVELYKETILKIAEEGRLKALDIDNSQGTYISRKQMNEMKIVTEEELDSEDLDVKIRAFWFPPYDGAYIERNGMRYTLVTKDILDTLVDQDTTALF